MSVRFAQQCITTCNKHFVPGPTTASSINAVVNTARLCGRIRCICSRNLSVFHIPCTVRVSVVMIFYVNNMALWLMMIIIVAATTESHQQLSMILIGLSRRGHVDAQRSLGAFGDEERSLFLDHQFQLNPTSSFVEQNR